MPGSEESLHLMVCDYLRLQYPKVLFRTDFAAGTKLSMGQAAKNKRLQSCRAWPDLFVAEPIYWWEDDSSQSFDGLFLELKKESTKLFLRDGVTMVADPHLREQAEVLDELQRRGYQAQFAVGFDEARQLIDSYLSHA